MYSYEIKYKVYIKCMLSTYKRLSSQGDMYLPLSWLCENVKQDVHKHSCDDCVSAAFPKMALSRPIKRCRRAKRCWSNARLSARPDSDQHRRHRQQLSKARRVLITPRWFKHSPCKQPVDKEVQRALKVWLKKTQIYKLTLTDSA